jgi:hypothetical protein
MNWRVHREGVPRIEAATALGCSHKLIPNSASQVIILFQGSFNCRPKSAVAAVLRRLNAARPALAALQLELFLALPASAVKENSEQIQALLFSRPCQ